MAKDNKKSWTWESMDEDGSSMDSWEATALDVKTPGQAMPSDIVDTVPLSIPEAMFNSLQLLPSPPPVVATRPVLYGAEAIKKK